MLTPLVPFYSRRQLNVCQKQTASISVATIHELKISATLKNICGRKVKPLPFGTWSGGTARSDGRSTSTRRKEEKRVKGHLSTLPVPCTDACHCCSSSLATTSQISTSAYQGAGKRALPGKEENRMQSGH